MRGKLKLYCELPACWRITPAGAGKTGNSGCISSKNEDHPRRCGENLHRACYPKACAGSPPQVRGKPAFTSENGLYSRITPAGAGKTSVCGSTCIFSWDHPRRCGENHNSACRMHRPQGSPPQVRGKRKKELPVDLNPRITPAGAGKTHIIPMPTLDNQDHPRRCGENIIMDSPNLRNAGSPPQVRGKLRIHTEFTVKRRITPAGAGKTCSFLFVECVYKDHPRRCGENLLRTL